MPRRRPELIPLAAFLHIACGRHGTPPAHR